MTPEEISNLILRIASQYESAVDQLVDKGLVNKSRQTFYKSLNEEKCEHLKRLGVIRKSYATMVRGIICEDMISLEKICDIFPKCLPSYIIVQV